MFSLNARWCSRTRNQPRKALEEKSGMCIEYSIWIDTIYIQKDSPSSGVHRLSDDHSLLAFYHSANNLIVLSNAKFWPTVASSQTRSLVLHVHKAGKQRICQLCRLKAQTENTKMNAEGSYFTSLPAGKSGNDKDCCILSKKALLRCCCFLNFRHHHHRCHHLHRRLILQTTFNFDWHETIIVVSGVFFYFSRRWWEGNAVRDAGSKCTAKVLFVSRERETNPGHEKGLLDQTAPSTDSRRKINLRCPRGYALHTDSGEVQRDYGETMVRSVPRSMRSWHRR